MRKTLILVLLIGMFLTACAPATPPPPTPDMAGTVQALSATMVAATLTAMPTATTIPTNTPPPPPTATPEPLITDTPASAGTATATAIPTDASTAAAFTGCFTPNGTTGLTAPFKIENMTKVAVTVYINGVTTEGDHTINCSYSVDPGSSTIFTIWFGKYSYWSVGKKTLSGTFWVNDSDKATMQVTDKNVKIGPFP